jgi:hypothetical protein
MRTSQEINGQIEQVKKLVDSDNKTEIKLNANGGNSILVVCPPEQENVFIEKSREILSGNKYDFIDLNKLLIEFISQHKEEILEKFNLLQSSVHQIFKSPPEEKDNDFFNYIIDKINEAYASGKVPVLYSVGSLYGTGIDNIQIIEHEKIMNAKLPLVILYPATDTKDKLMYLNSRAASKYRCMIIK